MKITLATIKQLVEEAHMQANELLAMCQETGDIKLIGHATDIEMELRFVKYMANNLGRCFATAKALRR